MQITRAMNYKVALKVRGPRKMHCARPCWRRGSGAFAEALMCANGHKHNSEANSCKALLTAVSTESIKWSVGQAFSQAAFVPVPGERREMYRPRGIA
jgi:hypothetical protein